MADLVRAAGSTFGAVASLYVWSAPREAFLIAVHDVLAAARIPRGAKGFFRRNDAMEILKRTVSLSAAAAVVVGCIGWPQLQGGATAGPASRGGSHHSHHAKEMVLMLCALWLGPMLEAPGQFFQHHVADRLAGIVRHPWGGLRELVVAPVAEELLFRFGTHHYLRYRTVGVRMLVGSTLFAAAHVHLMVNLAVEAAAQCLYETNEMQRLSGASMDQGLDDDTAVEIRQLAWSEARQQTVHHCGVVFAYGLLSAWLYEYCCGQSVVAAVCGHALCNFLGLPRFLFLRHGQLDALEGDHCTPPKRIRVASTEWRWSVLRRGAAAAAHIAGVALFVWRARSLSMDSRA